MGNGFSHAGGLARLDGGSKEEDRGGAKDGGDTVKARPMLAWRDAVDHDRSEVSVARALQCHKWHGDGGSALCVQRPSGPVAQRSDATASWYGTEGSSNVRQWLQAEAARRGESGCHGSTQR